MRWIWKAIRIGIMSFPGFMGFGIGLGCGGFASIPILGALIRLTPLQVSENGHALPAMYFGITIIALIGGVIGATIFVRKSWNDEFWKDWP